jgi:hypothetical protein
VQIGAEYSLGLVLALIIGIAIALPGLRNVNLWERIAAGMLTGFTGFVVGLMILTQVGNIHLNVAVAATIVSVVSRKTCL